MVKITIEIKSCIECPFVKTEKVYTGDNWEDVQKWTCLKKHGKIIYSYHEWNDKTEVPNWCPIKTD